MLKGISCNVPAISGVKIAVRMFSSKALAADFGAEESQGKGLFFFDADSYVVPNFIEKGLIILEKTRKGVIDYVQQASNPQATLWAKVFQFERKLLELHPDSFGASFVVKREVKMCFYAREKK